MAGLPVADGSTGSSGSSVRFSDLESLNSSSWFVNIPTFLIDFVKDTTEAQTLARPQLRISEGETGRAVIADRVPIPVTSFNTANTVGGNIVPLTSFQYQDVGITIEIKPRVHHNNEISLEIRVEVSNLAGSIGSQPIIGTREIETVIRLKDGETNFLAGLIRTDESVTESGVAGLSEIPLFGRLFSKKRTQKKRTDVVLTLTPHIIRRADITEEDLLPIWVGTETNFSFSGGRPALESPGDGPFDDDADREDALRQRQERLDRLPESLRNRRQQNEDGDDSEPSSGVELVPSLTPISAPPSSAARSGGAFGVIDPEERFEPLSNSETTEVFAVARSNTEDRTQQVPIEIAIEPSAALLSLGEVFEASVQISTARDISHLPMTLSWDPLVLDFLDAEDGDFLGDAGVARILVDASTTGVLEVGASRLGSQEGISGAGRLLKMRFRALSAGSTGVEIEKVRALDPSLSPIGPLKVVGSLVVVDAPQPGGLPRSSRAKSRGRIRWPIRWGNESGWIRKAVLVARNSGVFARRTRSRLWNFDHLGWHRHAGDQVHEEA